MLNDEFKDWESHEATANKCGGHLASITSEDEQAIVINNFTCNYYTEWSLSDIYFGAYLNEDEAGCNDCWAFPDKSQFSFSNWAEGLPDNHNGNEEFCTRWMKRGYGMILAALLSFVVSMFLAQILQVQLAHSVATMRHF